MAGLRSKCSQRSFGLGTFLGSDFGRAFPFQGGSGKGHSDVYVNVERGNTLETLIYPKPSYMLAP